MTRARLLPLLPFGALAALVVLVPLPFAPAPVTRDVTIAARQFAFDPPVLRVNRGDTVRLRLEASDVVHGLHLDVYGVEERIVPGVGRRVEFVADRTGKFRYRCSVSCGPLHPFMIGELIVSPNLAFVRAVALTVIVLAATLFSLRRLPPRDPAGGTA